MTLKKIPYTQSAELLKRCDLSEEAALVVSDDLEPADVVSALSEHKLYIDLVSFLSHSLPMRESIWWACLALELRESDWDSEQKKLIADAKRWVMEPDEARRRLAEQQVVRQRHKTAPGWLAQAVFWSGTGSIAPADEPQVMPPEFLYSKAVAGAINMAALMPEWQGYQSYYDSVIASGLDIAGGGRGG